MTDLHILSGDTRPVAPDLYGLFFEDINRAGDGGLYPEMLRNRVFEDGLVPRGCTADPDGGYFTTRLGFREPFAHGKVRANGRSRCRIHPSLASTRLTRR